MTLNSYLRSEMAGSSTAWHVILRMEPRILPHQTTPAHLATHPQTSPISPWEMNGAPSFQSSRTTGQICFIKMLLVPGTYGHSNLKARHSVAPFFPPVCGGGPGAPGPTLHVLLSDDTKAHSPESCCERAQHPLFRDSPLSTVGAVDSACCPTLLSKLS